jgi:predicted DNA-binding transcriptional regulator YafY
VKRKDRLFSILLALQQRNETAQSLADKMEVSKRTILRDMEALSEMGVPLYAVSGPSGGFRLMDGFKLAPLQLDSQEALTLLFALQSVTSLADSPFNKERWVVRDKVRSLLPQGTLNQIEPLLDHMEVSVPRRQYTTPYLSELLTYAAEGTKVELFYRSENHQRWVQVRPERVYTANGFWYCEAYSHTHGQNRMFRVDRIDMIRPLAQEDWYQTPPFKKEAGSKPPIRIVVKLTYKGMLRVERDEHVGDQVRAVSDEEWELDFQCPASELDWFVSFFYSLGMEADVVEPPSVRQQIYRMAEQMHERYTTNRGAVSDDEVE